MIGAVKPLGVPALQRGFEERREELAVRPSLQADSSKDLGVVCARLEFEKIVVFKKIEIGRNGKESFAEMDKDGDLQNGVGMKIYQLNVVILQQLTEERTTRETEPPLEIGFEHHYLVCIGGRQFLTLGWSP